MDPVERRGAGTLVPGPRRPDPQPACPCSNDGPMSLLDLFRKAKPPARPASPDPMELFTRDVEAALLSASRPPTLCERPQIEKHRHIEVHAGKTWEVDVFHGENEGLVIAELELSTETETFEMPPWVGEEVSSDPRYFNSSLAKNPYSTWALC